MGGEKDFTQKHISVMVPPVVEKYFFKSILLIEQKSSSSNMEEEVNRLRSLFLWNILHNAHLMNTL
jgi:hypothetical protein